MNDSTNSTGLRSFPRVFWVVNIMELFERGAYYGLNSVLAIYLTDSLLDGGLGFTEESVGFLQSIIYASVYIVPIIGGALADRYGYRRMLLVAFTFLATGYFLSGQVSTYGAVFAFLLLMALGAGLFKPIITGTIARTSTAQNSSFGFGIYYWMINLGAFIAPLAVNRLRELSWEAVFTASALYCALMLVPTVLMYKDPDRPADTKQLKDVLAGAAMVLGDARFMLMIVLYSGFWILYFQNFGSVLWFLRDFVDAAPATALLQSWGLPFTFDAEMVTIINALTIILLQFGVSKVVDKSAALNTMIIGMIIGGLGFVCLAFADDVWMFAFGIVVFSIGEMTGQPKYYSYVGMVAPADKKAVYMGYSFLYGVIGSLIGSSLGGFMYEAMLKPVVGTPDATSTYRLFWMIFAALDFVAMLGLLWYNRTLAADTPANNARARQIMIVVYGILLVIGAYFLYASVSDAETIKYRTMIQALIMLVLGAGGMIVSRKPSSQR